MLKIFAIDKLSTTYSACNSGQMFKSRVNIFRVPFRPTGTNIVTNTAPTPNVRMRIVMRNGQDASVVGLGEELQLRIEIDPSSAFGIFARNLEARTEYGELLTLIDNIG